MPRPRAARPRRVLIPLLLLLVGGGAVVNVAVTWAIAAVDPGIFDTTQTARDVPWPVARPADWPQECHRLTRTSAFADYVELSPNGASEYLALGVLFGWPMRCSSVAWYQRMHRNYLGAHDPRDIAELSIPPPSGLQLPPVVTRSGRLFRASEGRLPVAVAWRGFTINTLFYAVVVGAILALPLSVFPIRRRLRARSGKCPRCGYDRTGLADPAAPCPECGATP